MAKVELDRISKTFGPQRRSGGAGSGGRPATLTDVSLDVRHGEFLTLVGPSGCGKSTLLRIIAGLETQDAGSVRIGDRAVDAHAPSERDVAMVFQTYALYPHMTVAQNLALPLRMRRLSTWRRLPFVSVLTRSGRALSAQIAAEVEAVAKTLEIGHLLDRKPGQLSGGQRQRVALGRAMVRHPAVFLMDEPLSNLDGRLRVQMRAEIADLHRRLGVTIIYVTHDQVEAMTLSDRVAVMLGGEILQVATPQEVYARPASIAVAQLIGSPPINLIAATARAGGRVELAGGGWLTLAHDLAEGSEITLAVRAEDWSLGCGGDGAMTLNGALKHVEHLGPECLLHLVCEGSDKALVVRATPVAAQGLAPGQRVEVTANASKVLVFDAEGRLAPSPEAVLSLARSRA